MGEVRAGSGSWCRVRMGQARVGRGRHGGSHRADELDAKDKEEEFGVGSIREQEDGGVGTTRARSMDGVGTVGQSDQDTVRANSR